MCRFLAYQGEPIPIGTRVCAPCHSLVSEPLDDAAGCWSAVPSGCSLASGPAREVQLRPTACLALAA